MNYYNENDPYAARWLRNLIEAGLIPPGDVDDRSIKDVQGSDLTGYTQCHFFAGIGGWPYALELAGWPADRPVWTGSCPCQPFSSAGKRKGTDDRRHLWPDFQRLIAQCRPPIIFGEQVASKAGRGWLAGVRADLEALDYAVGAADLCTAGVRAPHIRQRLFWVADAQYMPAGAGVVAEQGEAPRHGGGGPANVGEILRANNSGLGLADGAGLEGLVGDGDNRYEPRRFTTTQDGSVGSAIWDDYQLVRCLEPTKEPGRLVEKWRRVEPGTCTMVDGLSFKLGSGRPQEGRSRAGMLRGYGNAIVPQLATEFIKAINEVTP